MTTETIIESSGIPSRQDVEAEMALDNLLEEIEWYFYGEIPPYWQNLIDQLEFNRLSYEWYEFRHPSSHTSS